MKIWHAQPCAAPRAAAGTVVDAGADGIAVAAGEGAMRITELQKAGGKRLPAAAFLAGTRLSAGARLGV